MCFLEYDYSYAQIVGLNKDKYLTFSITATNFLGELGGANRIGTNGLRDFDFLSIRPGFHGGYAVKLNKNFGLRANILYGWISGNDKFTKEPMRRNRNLHFRSYLLEGSVQGEYYFTERKREGHKYNLEGVKGLRHIHISSYLFAGVGAFYFNPKANYKGKWYQLKPLSTEGQGLTPTRKEYNLVQLCIPYGIGFTYAIDERWSVGLEIGFRKTFTDYIDDVSTTYFDPDAIYEAKGDLGTLARYFADPSNTSDPYVKVTQGQTAPGEQRGDPFDKDSYIFSLFSVYYKLPASSSILPKFRY
ncbi:MAG TPA: DUF6089 family protein [Bacteroidales bacterium]|nr:DUF6089 family protein [Bacteroidales bacterium]